MEKWGVEKLDYEIGNGGLKRGELNFFVVPRSFAKSNFAYNQYIKQVIKNDRIK